MAAFDRSLAELVLVFGYVLLAGLAVRAAFRRRDRYRLDVVLIAVFLLVSPLARMLPEVSVAPLQALAASLVPYALVRLIRHFRPVPGAWGLLAIGLPCLGFAGALVIGGDTNGLTILAVGFSILALPVIAAVLSVESVRAVGVRKWRLILAAAGAILLIPSPAFSMLATLDLAFDGSVDAVTYGRFASGLGFIAFFLAFNPPRSVFGRWQRGEHAHFLGTVSKREPEERGRHAPEDLLRGTERALGGAMTFVATRATSTAPDVVIRAATDRSLVGLRLEPASGMVERALERRQASIGSFRDCEREIAGRLKQHGATVIVAPVVSDEHVWGLVGVVHRRGALFAEDDVSLLLELGRTTATALDHAELVAERRERARREADRRLRQMESRVDLMLESIRDYGIFLLDVEGTVVDWQPGAEHLFGHSRDRAVGRSAVDLFLMEPEPFALWLADARHFGHAAREGACRRVDGATFTGATIIRPLVDEHEVLPGFVVVTQDVTKHRDLEERLRQGQKMEAIGRLAGGVAHDFNNLLQAIQGHADWLARQLKGDRREEINHIQQAAERGAELTRRLLAFSRRGELKPSSINLTALVGNILPTLRRLIDDHITMVDATTPDVPEIVGDETQLEQVVMNLVANARDAMPQGGTLTIRTADVWMESASDGVARGRYALLEVSDTGVGMDAETRRLAFEPFFTTKDVGQGTGLGLSTVYGIVQQLNGRIQVETEPGRGTSFRLYLPEKGSAAAEAESLSVDGPTGPHTVMFDARSAARVGRPL